ncbi:hypothetical protein ES703_72638 [subsurface metagenome]
MPGLSMVVNAEKTSRTVPERDWLLLQNQKVTPLPQSVLLACCQMGLTKQPLKCLS